MTIYDALKGGKEKLAEVSPTPFLDARVLMKHVLGKDDAYILAHGEDILSENETANYLNLLEKRAEGMPIAYITGVKEFMGLLFKVTRDTLIPRPDTEIAVMEAIDAVKNRGYCKVLDLCSGSGAIGLTVAAFLEFTNVTLSDINKEALEVSRENAETLGVIDRVQFIHSDLFQDIEDRFDLIVSNPPYISAVDMEALEDNVRNYEPHLALYGGVSGLDFYQKIVQQSKEHLVENGMLIFEIGYDQSGEVEKMMRDNGFYEVHTTKDLSGLSRVVSGLLIPET